MTAAPTQRRLAAILSADVAGYSRLMCVDEAGTLKALKAMLRDIVAPQVKAHRGRIVKTMGDGALVEFGSVVDAVSCAVAIQRALAEQNAALPEDRQTHLRIGVNLGDIIIERGDIFGDGVNLAARLQEVAPEGGVALSASAHDHAAGKVDVTFWDGGERALKNIAAPMRIWFWAPDGDVREKTIRQDAPPVLPDKPSIAILPFDNMSGDPDQEFFADGVVEAITAELSRIRSFFVIARNSAFAYKGRAVNVRDIGRELGVAYVLEGSVQRSGNRVRITVQLIETAGGAHLWAEKYDGSLDDIFDLQDTITEQIAGALQPSIRLAEVDRARRKPPHDMGAYDYTMRAISHVWMLEKDEATKALQLLDQALAADPDYPLALALAGWCWAQRSVYNWFDNIDEARANALSLAEKAASLSSDDPLVLAVLGTVHTFARNYGAARVLLERAIQLDPNAAWALSRLGWLETYADRPDAAKEFFGRAMRLSPLDPMNFNNLVGLASAHQVAGEDEAAAQMFLRALEERPNAHWIHRNLCAALLGAGKKEAALASRDTMMRVYPNMSVARFKNAMVFSPAVLDRIGKQMEELGVPPE
ncbi:adenylate/guanylate cyclase domain-containing protein [Aestuariivita boseongensis]|uniref:adenylate/guanylate cyclase domain-containing protein n=1 Tax=Aestuariivita boseongensis TaxID=1470562 RepID=UPI000681CBA4|nr:adenylate/guanylate cyclase domain-containing protein [Aestuariivita boseongensis]